MYAHKALGKTTGILLVVAILVAVGLGAAYELGAFIHAKSGYLTVSAQDPGPLNNVKLVYIKAEEIQIHDVNGTWITVLNKPTEVELNYVLNTTASLVKTLVPAGSYNQIRIIVPESGVTVTISQSSPGGGTTSTVGLANVTAQVPSGYETGLKISYNFSVGSGTSQIIVLHFHLVLSGTGQYILSPQTTATSEYTSAQSTSGFLSYGVTDRRAWM
ncbi:MAG: DUF4382 domain-containing protein [Candidatus Marsarchaeota archaeon]|nr:DUF4382 domain-containing protein [Candidatus Marsarchaeota archaeon]